VIETERYDEVSAKSVCAMLQETGNTLKRHQLTRLPPYLILFIKRFTSNNFVKERNPTIVNFPLRGVDLKDRES
jgi:U4/U6.U5 tri-snRNP-associated protein 2